MAVDSGLLLVIAGIAAVMDVHRAQVENGWILFALCMGLLWRILQEGPKGSLGFAAGAVFPLAVLGVLFYFRMLGPGDIKLFVLWAGLWAYLISVYVCWFLFCWGQSFLWQF